MTIVTFRRLWAVALAAVFVVGGCGGGASPSPSATGATSAAPSAELSGEPLSGTVTIDGSSTVYPITEAVAEEFQNANPNVQVPVAYCGGPEPLSSVDGRRNGAQRPGASWTASASRSSRLGAAGRARRSNGRRPPYSR